MDLGAGDLAGRWDHAGPLLRCRLAAGKVVGGVRAQMRARGRRGLRQGFGLATEGADSGPGAGERGGQRAEGPRTEAKQGAHAAWPGALLLVEALQVTAEEGEAGKVQGDRAGLAKADADVTRIPVWDVLARRPAGDEPACTAHTAPLASLCLADQRWCEAGPRDTSRPRASGDVTHDGLSLFFSQLVNLF